MKMTNISSLKNIGEKAGRKNSRGYSGEKCTHRCVYVCVCVCENICLRYFSDNFCYCTIDLVILFTNRKF